MIWPPRAIVRRDLGLWALESALHRRGLAPVAGVDEAGRGACAGPMVVAACILPTGPRGRIAGLDDSKLLTPAARERAYAEIRRRALSWSVITIPAERIDATGLHVCNVEGMRRAVAGLDVCPAYVLTDGFSVPGLPMPSLAVWKGDHTAACIAAASVLAKVTRDRIMTDLHEDYPMYAFDVHKGYVTRRHAEALHRHGPCDEHRRSYANVARVSQNVTMEDTEGLAESVTAGVTAGVTADVTAEVVSEVPADVSADVTAMIGSTRKQAR